VAGCVGPESIVPYWVVALHICEELVTSNWE
jgi:hypothetical protein